MDGKIIKCLLIADINSDILLIKSTLNIKEILLHWVTHIPGSQPNDPQLNHFDVILLDLDIWKDNYTSNFKKLYSISEEIPIIIINSESQEEAAIKLVEIGAADYLTKTAITKTILLRTISHARMNKLSREALQHSEIRFKTISTFAYNWEYWQDPDGSLRYISPSCEQITGYSADEFMEHPSLYKMIVVLEDRKTFSDHYAKRSYDQGQQKIEFRIRKKDGTIAWIEHRSQEVIDKKGVFLGIRVSCRDLTEQKKATEELLMSEKRFQTLIHSARDAILITEVDTGIIIDANKKSEELLGFPIHEIIGMHQSAIHPIDKREYYESLFQNRVMENKITPKDIYVQHKSGRKIPVEISSSVVDMQGRLIMLDIFHDVTDQKNAVEQLRKLSTAVEQSPVSVVITDTKGIIEYVNMRFVETTGYLRTEIYGKNVNILKSGQTPDDIYKNLWETIKSGKKWRGEIFNKKKSGNLFWEDTSISPIRNDDGEITHFLAVKEDITTRKETEGLLVHQANYDQLTDLPNRVLALDRASQAIARAKRDGSTVGVMFIDLDRFKTVNDTLGHSIGDKLLIKAAERLKKCIRESDTVARFGGDEFFIIQTSLNSLSDAANLARRILNAFSKPFNLESREMFITVSIGITGYPCDGDNAQVLLRNADTAMYQAKEASRNTYRFFTQEMNLKAVKRMNIESHLRYALEKGELQTFYQPIFNMRQEIIGAEALIRWQNLELGSVPPSEFILLAEETGLIIPIGEWMLVSASKQVKSWTEKFKMPLRLAINISARQFHYGDLVKKISDALKLSSLPAINLELEITERLILADDPKTNIILKALTKQGVRLSIDDFGTGYSSLSYLKKFPFNTLKIDRSFVNDVTKDKDSAVLAKTIISMAHSLGLEVVGEGVEKIDQLEFLKNNKCDLVQGYLFCKPLPVNEFEEFLVKHYAGRI